MDGSCGAETWRVEGYAQGVTLMPGGRVALSILVTSGPPTPMPILLVSMDSAILATMDIRPGGRVVVRVMLDVIRDGPAEPGPPKAVSDAIEAMTTAGYEPGTGRFLVGQPDDPEPRPIRFREFT